MKSHRNFFDDLFKKLNLQTWEDWYRVKYKDIADIGGKLILGYFGDSHIEALQAIYPGSIFLRL